MQSVILLMLHPQSPKISTLYDLHYKIIAKLVVIFLNFHIFNSKHTSYTIQVHYSNSDTNLLFNQLSDINCIDRLLCLPTKEYQ